MDRSRISAVKIVVLVWLLGVFGVLCLLVYRIGELLDATYNTF